MHSPMRPYECPPQRCEWHARRKVSSQIHPDTQERIYTSPVGLALGLDQVDGESHRDVSPEWLLFRCSTTDQTTPNPDSAITARFGSVQAVAPSSMGYGWGPFSVLFS
jgi:hypothetical protein